MFIGPNHGCGRQIQLLVPAGIIAAYKSQHYNVCFKREGYKLHIPLHKSSVTGRFEVGGFLFLASENQEYVHKGLMFFKQSLTYTSHDIGQRFLFFVDKDFSYIEVRKE